MGVQGSFELPELLDRPEAVGKPPALEDGAALEDAGSLDDVESLDDPEADLGLWLIECPFFCGSISVVSVPFLVEEVGLPMSRDLLVLLSNRTFFVTGLCSTLWSDVSGLGSLARFCVRSLTVSGEASARRRLLRSLSRNADLGSLGAGFRGFFVLLEIHSGSFLSGSGICTAGQLTAVLPRATTI